jgi:hypothetical protein
MVLKPAVERTIWRRRISRLAAFAVVVSLLTVPGQLAARTWYVERDGGAFKDIQSAVDVAASGDTIRISPGRFNEGRIYSNPGWTELVRVLVTQHRLTIIGSGEETIIGQTEPWDLSQGWHHGIYAGGWYGNQEIEIRNIRFENMAFAVTVEENHRGDVADCWFGGNHTSIITFDGEVLNVDRCRFENSARNGVLLVAISRSNVNVRDCEFILPYYHQWVQSSLNLSIVNNGLIEDCTFTGGYGGIFAADGEAIFRNCTFDNQRFTSSAVGFLGRLILEHCTYRNATIAMGTGDSSAELVARHCVVESARDCSVEVNSIPTVSIQDCDLAAGSRGTVWVRDCTVSPSPVLDFTNNYWGTDDADEIQGLIRDHNTDPAVCQVVNFIPFRSHSVPVHSMSLSGVKGLFR